MNRLSMKMKFIWFTIILLAVSSLGLFQVLSVPAQAREEPIFSPHQPLEVAGRLLQEDEAERARAASIFSWKTFVALQWPASGEARGLADFEATLRDTREAEVRVWETWKEPFEVYLPEGKRPSSWDDDSGPSLKLLRRVSKVSDVLDEDVQATQADGRMPPILTDQKGKLVRYEIRMNKIVFDHIMNNELYDGREQTRVQQVSYPVGACLLKASWKEVGLEDRARYLTANCLIEEAGQSRRQLMGLVGFHIMIKTPSAPQWIWATFEHVDNVEGSHPSFFDPSKPELPINLQTRAGQPNQVTRVVPIPSWLGKLNSEMQSALAKEGSILRNYQLVETQRPLKASNQKEPATVFSVEPEFLSNTTQETFVQNSSCMGCHAMASTLNNQQFVSGDFTFTLNNAEPKPPELGVIPAPERPATDWERDNWSLIERGLSLSNQTYELLPNHVGARLHCTSCHLDGGRKETASWWVGMPEKYDYPDSDRLQQRVQRCFTHSMNGTPVEDEEMNAIVAYIQWIDLQASPEQRKIEGFPPIEPGVGESARGKTIYRQKCNFCHNDEGQGRYLGDTYFRPALWGGHSFPKRAGMGKTETLAAFIKANMPLNSGGMLTTQEAWDLAAYIESQKRP